MADRTSGIIDQPIDELLSKVDSKYQLVIFASKRARQINAYYSQLGEGLLEYVGPLVETHVQEKPLSSALREINADLLTCEDVDPAELAAEEAAAEAPAEAEASAAAIAGSLISAVVPQVLQIRNWWGWSWWPASPCSWACPPCPASTQPRKAFSRSTLWIRPCSSRKSSARYTVGGAAPPRRSLRRSRRA